MVRSAVEMLLSLRILLKFFNASSTAPFVRWLYGTTSPLLHPFEGMFPSPELEGGIIIEFSALFALIVYSFIGYFLTQSLNILMEEAKDTD